MEIGGNENNNSDMEIENSDPVLTSSEKKFKKNSKFNRRVMFSIESSEGREIEADPNCKIAEGHFKCDCVLVHDEESMERLYCMGFFGKGTLSKYGPKICFEEETVKAEKQKQGSTSSSPEVITIYDSDDDVSNSETLKASNDNEVLPSDLTDKNVCGKDNNLNHYDSEEKESLQLTFQEAFFLCHHLRCLIVKDEEEMLNASTFWIKICQRVSNFPVMYAAYHHLRTKGWIVKNGLEFGNHYVMYEDGPPFCDPTYSVIVRELRENLREIKGNNKELTWTSLNALLTKTEGAGMKLIILQVLKPLGTKESFYATPSCIPQLKIQAFLHQRLDLAKTAEEQMKKAGT